MTAALCLLLLSWVTAEWGGLLCAESPSEEDSLVHLTRQLQFAQVRRGRRRSPGALTLDQSAAAL
mgnify:CR=1 FL=1